MFSKTTSAALHGMDVNFVQVEADISEGLPVFDMVGLLGSEVREARERVRIAIRSSGFRIPPKRITVNLSPADLRKEGSAFDLSIAVAILMGLSIIPQTKCDNMIIMGELSLDGAVNPVRGMLPVVRRAREAGYHTCILPVGNYSECRRIQGIQLVGVKSVREVIGFLRDGTLPELRLKPEDIAEEELPDFADLAGQETARRAAEIAVTGRHHLLLCGPPGAGKTMVIRRMAGIMPDMTEEESMLQAELSSICGQEPKYGQRPFRSPEQSITKSALLGGGKNALPGEVVLASGGILFMDELTEFSRKILESLRQPMEEGQVTITRLHGTYQYPAEFLFAGTMNPCPCGHYPNRQQCKCTPEQIVRYWNRIDGPLLDRIDLFLEMQPLEFEHIAETRGSREFSAEIRERVCGADRIQRERYKGELFSHNGKIPADKIHRYCPLESEETRVMERYFQKYHLTGRGYHKVLRVARTIADLEGSERIRSRHLTEAVFYRSMDKMQGV